jgi:tetratricopeptide (TPR) repeat protein
MKRSIFALAITFCLAINSAATTWFPEEFTCPIDKEKNTFQVIGSYGSYIYAWPSKYQWLFWPRTDSPTFYLCRKCHLASYMWDFDKIPKDKIPAIKKVLEEVKVSKNFKDYREIPVTERLEIMAKVYAVLDKDNNWWNEFYRTEGYHYQEEGQKEKAADARRKALALTEKELQNKESEMPAKLLLYTLAAMKHFTGDDKGALADLEKALATKYEANNASAEEAKNAEDGLNERIRDYVERIKSNKKPRDSEQ